MRPDLALEEDLDALGERHDLRVAQLGVRLRVAVLVPADRRCLVAFGEDGKDGLPGGGRKLQGAGAREAEAARR